ncbi:MAG: hypothetical protein GY820_11170 [Gammaproteobacteria bacterium]|nr:hypothetical protein [Gammaproteobacteria bacterium]
MSGLQQCQSDEILTLSFRQLLLEMLEEFNQSKQISVWLGIIPFSLAVETKPALAK